MLTLNAAAEPEPDGPRWLTFYPQTRGAATPQIAWWRTDRMPTVSLPHTSVAAGCNPTVTYIIGSESR